MNLFDLMYASPWWTTLWLIIVVGAFRPIIELKFRR